MKNQRAFTLIELLVVIAIIGILSGLIIVAMGGAVDNANIAKSKVFATSLRDSLLANLVSEWKFDGSGVADGGTATTAYTQDTWSGGNNCAIGGSPLVYSGNNCLNGSCLRFNGTNTYLDCGNVGLGNKSFALSAWMYSTSGAGLIVGTGSQAANKRVNLSANLNGTYRLAFYTTNLISSLSYNNSGKWTFFSATYDYSTGRRTLYRNGVQTDTDIAPDYYDGTGNFQIGGFVPSSDYFNGTIDEVRIFSAAIPTSQIKEQYYAGLNRLLTDGRITKKEYISRIEELNNPLAKSQ